ncbi:sarcosine oxidase subunit alpha [Roseibium hamelinense]|uniref:Sarcosine oxidase subunit alpha n=1 Tax=Roseibium hamelinense TaxID=150831 RepID=A0A562SU16_9HYPH|nr:sarcosine oxidase subunit alpha family protein [Roseibium hamelinense]MTI43217.1 sarcosine oxidase subunit alpha family protein [Roseibium hamelinense]TWI84732.1 sarcosine oxidase subunit alpha [Roseibium hamelinense]
MTARRLESGGRIDRNQKVTFDWDGKALSGFAGDTLASALMANGETVLGRSFKYHRPRGIMSAGVEESGAIVTVGKDTRREPNVKATMQELYDGLTATGQNAWPNVRFDLGAVNGLFSRFFAAGFYYKTFMGLPPFEWGSGTGLWMQYEKLIRRAAGMGTASRAPDPDHYDHAHGFCDVLVVGAGPAGLNAALTAAEAGRDVLLVEQDFELGGDYLNDPAAEPKRAELVTAVRNAGVHILTRTTAFGLYDDGTAGLLEKVTDHLRNPDPSLPRQRFWTVRAGATILATGALERSIAFENNDRPGVMTAAAARVYLNRYGVLPGTRILIATNNDSAYGTAVDLEAAGAQVTVIDSRAEQNAGTSERVSIQYGLAPLEALGRPNITGVELAADTGNGWKPAGKQGCDLLLISGGWSPVVNLSSHRGAKPAWNAEQACFLPGQTKEPIFHAGSAAGIWPREACETSGVAAAQRATGEAFQTIAPGGWARTIKPVYEVRASDRVSKAFVDFQHDVTGDDIRLAHQEGFVSVEHLKRYTTLGMATDQGRMGNVIGLALMADALGKDIPDVGTTRFRPPYTPVAIGALAGRNVAGHFKALRRTPLHDWNLRHGATMTEAGLWHRPWYFAQDGETIDEAYVREAATVRETVGICDVSSLGKIAVQGPDAAEFLNRVYSNGFAKLPVGKARYGIMLRDDGMVMDDGTTWRLGETDFLTTTTTAHAGKVMVWFEELLQTRWPDLKVHVSSVSDHWAGVSIAGPKSREAISAILQDGTDISNEALPFMGVAGVTLKGNIHALIARISFSGERAYELYVPAGFGEAMMDLLWPSAKALGGCLYGMEALGTLRIEKGHVTGAELDGRVTIDDAGLGKMASTKKAFIGSALRQRPELLRQDRPQLIGIFPKDKSQRFKGGSILCAPDGTSGFGDGWITAVTHSPALGHWIGIGYISGGVEAWRGLPVIASDPTRSGDVEVEIVSPHMVDPEGVRVHG